MKKTNVLTFDNLRLLDKKKPNDVFNKNNLYFRPGRNEFLDYLFLKVYLKMIKQNSDFFDVAVWSSLDKEKT